MGAEGWGLGMIEKRQPVKCISTIIYVDINLAYGYREKDTPVAELL